MRRIDSSYRQSLLIESLLLEVMSLDDVHAKYYNKIPQDEFLQIVHADPTSGDDKMGKYSKWLLGLYIKGDLKTEDLYKATEYLTVFNKYKAKLDRKDITQYNSLPDLYDTIQPYEDNAQAASKSEEIRNIKNEGAEKVYEDGEWLVIVPKTEEAACYYGKGTKWCTAATGGHNMFKDYDAEGPLYININKKTGRKFQFHFESEQFMDERDRPVKGCDICLSNGLKAFYFRKYNEDALPVICDTEEEFCAAANEIIMANPESHISDNLEGGSAIVYVADKYNYLKPDGKLLSPNLWFDYTGNFYDGFAMVEIEGSGCNYLNLDGKLLSPNRWFDGADGFYEGFAPVKIEGKGWNYLKTDGKLLSPNLWFDDVYDFNNGFARVYINGKGWYDLNSNGELIL